MVTSSVNRYFLNVRERAAIDDWGRSAMIPHEIDRWASVMHAARPDWRHDSLRTFATNNLAARPYRDALVAGVWVASDLEARTPALLTKDGPWWAACQQRGSTTEPGIITRCPHGRPTDTLCAECSGDALGVPMPADLRARYRAARDAPTEGVEP